MTKRMNIPRVMLAGTGSGCGKTLITCGVLTALKERGLGPVSFKCGPDYIDPMFHTAVIGTPSRNIDTFFTGPALTRYLFCKNAAGSGLAVIEGVMGFYDGLGGTDLKASSWDAADVLDVPVVLIVNARGMSRSVLPLVRGFAAYTGNSHIAGVILNRVSGMLYPALADMIREETGLETLGYVPVMKELSLESRHLGLVLPDEVEGIREKLHLLARTLEKTIDMEALLRLAHAAPVLDCSEPEDARSFYEEARKRTEGRAKEEEEDSGREMPVVAVARDEAFCFLYQDNLELLEEAGARLVYFSPLHDKTLPAADGLLLCGGYPELHLEALSANTSMLAQVREAVTGGMPCLAECGGFMYLHSEIGDDKGRYFKGAGVFQGRAFRTSSLKRFGYVTLTGRPDNIPGGRGVPVRGHEFHYYDTTCGGEDFHAVRGSGRGSWDCMHAGKNYLAGFPHLYYWSNPRIALDFVGECAVYHKQR